MRTAAYAARYAAAIEAVTPAKAYKTSADKRASASAQYERDKADPIRLAARVARKNELRRETREERNARQSEAARRRRARLDAIKVTVGCVDCGYREFPEALAFDHVDPMTKAHPVSQMMSVSWARVVEELSKCVVRCANCHAVRTKREHHHSVRRNG